MAQTPVWHPTGALPSGAARARRAARLLYATEATVALFLIATIIGVVVGALILPALAVG